MNGDWRKHVASGDKTNLTAQWYNNVTDGAARSLGNTNNQPVDFSGNGREGTILVQNNSGAAVPQLGILAIDAILITPAQNPQQFIDGFALAGVAPTADYFGQFVVTCEPIAAGAIGAAWVDGVCPANVYMNNTADLFCDLKPSDSTQLQSGPIGGAQILWSKSGTGMQPALIRLGNTAAAAPSISECLVQATSGSAGSVSGTIATVCTYTYSAVDINTGATFATGMVPTWGQPNGNYLAGSRGFFSLNTSGTGSNVFVLCTVNNLPAQTTACPS